MTPTLTPIELSELCGLLLEKVGALNLIREQGELTAYGYQRMETLTALYHKLNTTAVEPEVQAPVRVREVFRGRMMNAPVPDVPSREVFRDRLTEAYNTITDSAADPRSSAMATMADFVYDILFLQGHEAPKIEAIKYLRQYADLPLHKAKAIIHKATR